MKKLKNIRNIINIIFNLFTNCRNRSISLTYDGNVIVYFAYVLSINHFSLHFSFQIIFFFFSLFLPFFPFSMERNMFPTNSYGMNTLSNSSPIFIQTRFFEFILTVYSHVSSFIYIVQTYKLGCKYRV